MCRGRQVILLRNAAASIGNSYFGGKLYIIMLVHSRYELSVGQSVSHTSVVFLCMLLYIFVRSVGKVG
jgi:hypothetical protein